MRKIPKKEIKIQSQERGMILVVAIMVVIVMLIMALPFLSKLSSQNRATERSAWSLSALNLAEAGVERFLWKVNNSSYYIPPPDPNIKNPDPEPIVWVPEGSNERGTIKSIWTADGKIIGNELGQTIDNVSMILFPRLDNGSLLPATRLLESTGNVPFIASNPSAPVKRTVRAYLEEYFKSIWDYGFFVNQYFKAKTQFYMDAFDSGKGPYGGTNAGLDAYFGANSYEYETMDSFYSWGTNTVNGKLAAGGTAAELHNLYPNDPAYPAPDPNKLNDVITIKGVDDNKKLLMTEEYQLPPVDVYNLPPKETIPAPFPSVGDWFNTSYSNGTNRFDRAPVLAEIKTTSTPAFSGGTHTYNNDGNLTPNESGVYTSFVIPQGHILTVKDGNVVIYVTALGDKTVAAGNAGNFFMGKDAHININAEASLTIILGNASFSVEQGFQINAQNNSLPPSPPSPLPAKCVILGTDQFAMPSNLGKYAPNPKKPGKLEALTLPVLEDMKAAVADTLKIPGFMTFEQGAGSTNGKIYSAIYIPRGYLNGESKGANNTEFFGSILSDSMNFKTQINFHYDKALADLKLITGGFPQWKLVSLQEKVPAN